MFELLYEGEDIAHKWLQTPHGFPVKNDLLAIKISNMVHHALCQQ